MAALHDADALLIYQVGPVRCCAPTGPIEQIVMPPDLTHPPGSDAARPGIFKHGQHIVSVIDLRQRFGIAPADWQPGRLVITVLARGYTAFWVDRIVDVIRMPTEGWGGLPPHLPREAFSRTLLHANQIHLYTELEELHKLHPAGFLRQYIAHLEQQQAPPPPTEPEPAPRSERQPVATAAEPPPGARPPSSRSAPAAPRPASHPPVTRQAATPTRPASSSSAPARPASRTDPATKPGTPTPQARQPDETAAQGVKAPRPAPPTARAPAASPGPQVSVNRAGEAPATTSTQARDPGHSARPAPSLAARAGQPDLTRGDEAQTESSGLLAILLVLLLLAGLGIGGYVYLLPEPTATLTRAPAPREPIAVVAPTPPPHNTEPSPSSPLPEPEPGPAPDPEPAPTGPPSLNDTPDTPLARNPLAGLSRTAPPYRATIEQDEAGITLIFEQPAPVIPPLSDTSAPEEDPSSDNAVTDPPEPGEAAQNGPADVPAAAPPSRETIVHIVERGDTLWDIASRYINNPWRYPELAENSDIRNPNLIYPGDRVRIIIYRGRRP